MATELSARAVPSVIRRLHLTRIAIPVLVTLITGLVSVVAVNVQTVYQTVPIVPSVRALGFEAPIAVEHDWVLVHEGMNLVYARNIARVAVIDGITNTFIRHIDVGLPAFGAAIDPLHNRLYLAHGIDGMSVVDTLSETVVDFLDFGFVVGGAAVDPLHEEVYVSNGPSLLILSALGGQHVVLHTVALPGSPQLVDVDPTRRRVYAQVNNTELAVVDTANGAFLFTVPLPAGSFRDMAVNPQTGFVYLTTLNANSVIVLDASAASPQPPVVVEVFLGEQTFSVDVDAPRNRVYVLEHQGPRPGTLWIINGETHAIEKTIQLSFDGSADQSKEWCWDSHHMDENPVTGRVYASCPIGAARHVAVVPTP